MKNQYFGDTRDLFKYDLILELLLRTGLRRFTFIPMLTRDEGTDGGKTNYRHARAGTRRRFLTRFLQDCVREGRRDIRELKRLFRAEELAGFELRIHGEATYFTHADRKRYFSSIGEELLTRAVIVVDPDNGLEVKSGKGEKYVTYEEVAGLYRRMDGESVLVVFQFIPRVKREEYFAHIGGRIRREVALDSRVQFVSDGQVVFFLLTKREAVCRTVEDATTTYAGRYGLTRGGC